MVLENIKDTRFHVVKIFLRNDIYYYTSDSERIFPSELAIESLAVGLNAIKPLIGTVVRFHSIKTDARPKRSKAKPL